MQPLATETTGIKGLTEMVTLLAAGYEGFVKAKADGTINAADIAYLMPVLMAIGPAVSDASLIIPEAKDLSSDELATLLTTVKAASPSLASETEVLLKVQACLNLLRAGKDAYVAFFTTPAAAALV